MTQDHDRIWPLIQDELRRAVPAPTYDIWLAPLRAVEIDGDDVVLAVPRETRRWVAERYLRVLQACTAAVVGPSATVELRAVDDDHAELGHLPAAGRPARTGARRATRAGPGSAVPDDPRGHRRFTRAADTGAEQLADVAASDRGDRLNPKFTFDQFVIGPANRFAHAASLAVAELPGQAYNPLFIYGPPGVGKTHLLHSVGNYIEDYGGGLSVRYTTVETFTNRFVAAIRGGGIEHFKERFRRVDVLLIDDVQFLADKTKTEEEFFHTFNALQATGSQLVLTSDRVPRDLDGVHDRLRERFEAGLVTDIAPPDRATRMTVLRKRIAHDGVDLRGADEVLELIAERVTTNIRALEGALIRVVAFASLTGRPLDAELARRVLDDLYPQVAGPRPAGGIPAPPATARRAATADAELTIERIQDATARAFGIDRDTLLSACRTGQVAWARQVAMYLTREHTDATLPAIGRAFGGRNHTTVLHAYRRAAARLAQDPEVFDLIRRLTAELGVAVHDAGPDRSC